MTKEERLKAAEAYIKPFRHQLHLGEEQSVIDTFVAGAEAEAESKWVSVNDKLPNDSHGRVLAYVTEINDLGVSNFVWNCSYSALHGFTDNWKEYIVTHWMELPSPPLNQQ